MKKLIIIASLFLFFGCSINTLEDCFTSAGDSVELYYDISGFTKLRIEKGVSAVIKQAANFEIRVETKENIVENIQVYKQNDILVVREDLECNLVRDYGLTRVYITVPNLTEIKNSSSYNIESDGTLVFKNLNLISNSSGNVEDIQKSGDFRLDIETENLMVSANGQSVFYLSGDVIEGRISFLDEWPRFEGANLRIQHATVFQRSANDIIVFPIQEIKGEIRGTGNVIAKNRPPIVAVKEFFTGKLLFQD